ncbi:uncharacterized protein LOC106079268 [Biomphalaria glabrata]|uniref:Uncharacterized protein LOC106079268 n=1 Tax=Biomphalaria glabrata TaxID=6526 RepID=A0A9U8ENC9_BIOGL|nr:uncharacterized protein LOC106079268 [Biomphalaria glabrata]
MPFTLVQSVKPKSAGSTKCWIPNAEDEGLRTMELLMEEKISRRFQKWCRACVSEHCCLENQNKQKRNTSEETMQTRLQAIKKKRKALESYLDIVDRLITSCHYDILHKRFQPTTDNQLPVWLAEVLRAQLILPLVPTFPTSASSFAALCSSAGLCAVNKELQEEYLREASYARRLHLSSPKSKVKRENISLINVAVQEVITGGQNTSDVKITETCSNKTETYSQLNYSTAASLTLLQSKSSDFVSGQSACEKIMKWVVDCGCEDAKITECGEERVVIQGLLLESDLSTVTRDPGGLAFKLILMVGDRSESRMQIKGTFFRKSTISNYDLRWKYTVDISTL